MTTRMSKLTAADADFTRFGYTPQSSRRDISRQFPKTNEPMGENGRRRLTSWKEIASHLGRDVRTVLRWEKQRGLPVYRVPGETGRVVFAYTDELDAWAHGGREEKPDAAAPPLVEEDSAPAAAVVTATPSARVRWLWPAAALVLAAAGLGAVWKWRARVPAAEIESAFVTAASVQATTADGRVLWAYPLPHSIETQYSSVKVIDIDGDAHPDVVASLIVRPTPADTEGALLALDHAGHKLWERRIGESRTFGGAEFLAPWLPDNLDAFEIDRKVYFAWAVHHHTWWPSLLAVFDGRGNRVGAFVNSGWIRNSTVSGDGRYLLAGGISNARNGAAFAVLDPRHPDGSSPETPGSPYECRDCPQGVPLRYYVIPWTDIIDPVLLGSRRGQPMSYRNGSIELRAVQRQNGEVILELTPTLDVKGVRLSDGFWDWHAQMERDGTLHHARDACPIHKGITVFEWTPEQGWREILLRGV
jgi:hypothetical protein